jgi:hypothetical protein
VALIHKLGDLSQGTGTNTTSVQMQKQKNEHHQILSPHLMGGRPRKPYHYTQNDTILSTLRYEEDPLPTTEE